MKKLKIALSLIFALTFSLFLVACGGGGEVMDYRDQYRKCKDGIQRRRSLRCHGVGSQRLLPRQRRSRHAGRGEVFHRQQQIRFFQARHLRDRRRSRTDAPQKTRSALRSRTPSRSSHNWVDNGDGTASCDCGARQEVKELTDTVTTVGWGQPGNARCVGRLSRQGSRRGRKPRQLRRARPRADR